MNKVIHFFFSVCFLLVCLIQFAGNNNPQPDCMALFNEANGVFKRSDTNEAEDSTALAQFRQVIALLNGAARNDSLLFECYNKAGVLALGLDKPAEAIPLFTEAIAWAQRLKKTATSVFEAWVFKGRACYTLNNYDSALYCYRMAEHIADPAAGNAPNTERLYNSLGVLHYDLGNYKLAKNYFEKALNTLGAAPEKNSDYEDLYFRYQNNISACLLRISEFDAANSICDDLLRRTTPEYTDIRNILYHRKADINLSLGAAEKALDFLKKVHYTDRNRLQLLNDYGRVFYNLGQYAPAMRYLDSSLRLNSVYFPSGKSVDLANTYKIMGDISEEQGDYEAALRQYQLSLIALRDDFNDTALHRNPGGFKGLFAANILFEHLSKKAATLEKYFMAGAGQRHLEAALGTYQSVFELADYMENIYDSEASRLFLNRKKHAAHDRPIQISLRLYDLTKDKQYLESAFYFDQQNKGSTLQANLKEQAIRKNAGIPDSLLAQERELKLQLTVLALKATQAPTDSARRLLGRQAGDCEIKLNKIAEKMREGNPRYAGYQQQLQHIPASALMKTIPQNTCVLSYHIGEERLICFWIRHNDWGYFSVPVNDSFTEQLTTMNALCSSAATGNDYAPVARKLYSLLMAPIERELQDATHLLIIPDDELFVLPFETLLNSAGDFLVQQFSIGYNFSCNLLPGKPGSGKSHRDVLAAAPFATNGNAQFGILRSSGAEIAPLNGRQLLNGEATKRNFLALAPGYPILHLATHANTGNARSEPFIAFSSDGPDSSRQYLYNSEIYNLDLSATQLVYLSACETGLGQLTPGEGMMSLSRAFAYAGCPNIITSLWQADDASTAMITRSFYSYFNKGYPEQAALRQAKLDYLNNPEVEQRKKTPFYWGHLIFVGQHPAHRSSSRKWLIIFPVLAGIGAVLWRRRIKRKRQSAHVI